MKLNWTELIPFNALSKSASATPAIVDAWTSPAVVDLAFLVFAPGCGGSPALGVDCGLGTAPPNQPF